MAFEDVVVVICMLDDKIKLKEVVHFIVKLIIGSVFLGILIGLFVLFHLVKWT